MSKEFEIEFELDPIDHDRVANFSFFSQLLD